MNASRAEHKSQSQGRQKIFIKQEEQKPSQDGAI